jgi:uncharacterized protein YceK
MRALLVGLVLPFLMTASGCGTVGNVLGPRQYPHVYGGVEFDWLALQSTWSRSMSDESKASGSVECFGETRPRQGEAGPLTKAVQAAEGFGQAVLLTSLIAIDFPLSFIGDTITLPDVLFQSGFRGWDSGQDEVPTPHSSRITMPDIDLTSLGSPEMRSVEPTPGNHLERPGSKE